jgi:hypothetical protein
MKADQLAAIKTVTQAPSEYTAGGSNPLRVSRMSGVYVQTGPTSVAP